MLRRYRFVLVGITLLFLGFSADASILSTDPKTVMSNTKIDHLDGMGKIVASGPLISKAKTQKNLSSYKLVSLFDKSGNLYDTQLYITTSFADWNYINKGTSYGKPISVTPIKKHLNCKVNPCSYLETVAIHFKEFSTLTDEANKDGTFRFKLMGKSFEKEYVIPRSYIKGFVLAVSQSQMQIKQLASKNQANQDRLKASID